MYLCPSDPNGRAPGAAQTSYVAVVGPNAAWAGEKPRKLADFGKDALPHDHGRRGDQLGHPLGGTAGLVAGHSGSNRCNSPALALSSDHGRREEFFFTYDYGPGINVAMADGSVRFLRTDNRSPEDLRKILQIGGFKEEEIGITRPLRRSGA